MDYRDSLIGGGVISHNLFYQIISFENLFLAWLEFRRGKRQEPDVQAFEFNLEDNLFLLHEQLSHGYTIKQKLERILG